MDPNKAHYVAATAIIIKYGKYLITRRSEKELTFPGKWTVPGGKLERRDYESRKKDTAHHWYNVVETLLRREVREETNLEIKDIEYLTSLTFIRPDGIPVLVLSFYANYDSGTVKLTEDMSQYKWVTLAELKDYDLIEGIYEEFEMLENKLKGIRKGWSISKHPKLP